MHLEGVDADAGLLDLLGDGLGDELVHQALQVNLGRLCKQVESSSHMPRFFGERRGVVSWGACR